MTDDKKTKSWIDGLTPEELNAGLNSYLEKCGSSTRVQLVSNEGLPRMGSITGNLRDALMSKASASGSAQGE